MESSTITHALRITARRTLTATALAVLAMSSPAVAKAAPDPADRCVNTADAADAACRKESAGDFWLAEGTCENLTAPADRTACIRDARQAHKDANDDCDAQFEARDTLCDALGRGAYDPPINPANFTTTINNPFLPWVPGTVFTYDNTNGEHIVVTVLPDTLPILGVDCVTVHDQGTVSGLLLEDTYDYYAQDLQGNVWYFGEDTVQYDEGRVVGVEGAWRGGVNGAKPGIVMEASSTPGDIYRQEFLLGEAEDQAEVLSTNASATVPFGGAYNGLIKTSETSSLEPDGLESKYYASGIGLILTVDEESGEREELVGVTP